MSYLLEKLFCHSQLLDLWEFSPVQSTPLHFSLVISNIQQLVTSENLLKMQLGQLVTIENQLKMIQSAGFFLEMQFRGGNCFCAGRENVRNIQLAA